MRLMGFGAFGLKKRDDIAAASFPFSDMNFERCLWRAAALLNKGVMRNDGKGMSAVKNRLIA